MEHDLCYRDGGRWKLVPQWRWLPPTLGLVASCLPPPPPFLHLPLLPSPRTRPLLSARPCPHRLPPLLRSPPPPLMPMRVRLMETAKLKRCGKPRSLVFLLVAAETLEIFACICGDLLFSVRKKFFHGHSLWTLLNFSTDFVLFSMLHEVSRLMCFYKIIQHASTLQQIQ